MLFYILLLNYINKTNKMSKRKYPTDTVYFVGYCITHKKYAVSKQSKFSSMYCDKKYGTWEEAQVEADFLNKRNH